MQPDVERRVGKGSRRSGVGSKDLTCFQKASRDSAFFFDRGREGLPPKGRAKPDWQSLEVAAGQPLVYPLPKLLAHSCLI